MIYNRSSPAFSLESTRASREPVRDTHASATREALNGKERKGKERVKTGVIKNSIHCPVAKDDVLKIFYTLAADDAAPASQVGQQPRQVDSRRIADGLQRG